jgi:hypothetical protein
MRMIVRALHHGLLRFELSIPQGDYCSDLGFSYLHIMVTFLTGPILGLKFDDGDCPLTEGMSDLGVRPAISLGMHPQQLDKF